MTKREGGGDDVDREPIISEGYPDRLIDLQRDLQEHRREIAAIQEILSEQPKPGLRRRLIRHYLVLETYKYGQRAQFLRREIAKVAHRIKARSRRHKLPPPFHEVPGPQKGLSKTLKKLKGPRDKVIAHRFEANEGKFISIARAESLTTWPREPELLQYIEEIDRLVAEACAWIYANLKTVRENVDRKGRLLS